MARRQQGPPFKDTWTLDDVDLAWHGEIAEQNPGVYAVIDTAGVVHGAGMKSYLIMMAVRVLEMHRLLKPTGSLYLHCDPTASHYLKLLLDAVFQPTLFVNEIAWCYNVGGKSKKHWARKHDTLLFYTKSKNWHFNGSAVGIPRDTGAKSFGGRLEPTIKAANIKISESRQPENTIATILTHRKYQRIGG